MFAPKQERDLVYERTIFMEAQKCMLRGFQATEIRVVNQERPKSHKRSESPALGER